MDDQDDKAIRAIGLGPDNAGPDHPKWDGGWMPIETAPKDTKARIVWCPAWRNTFIVSWLVPFGEPIDNGYWAHFGGACTKLSERPTHWMPLPQPPKEDK